MKKFFAFLLFIFCLGFAGNVFAVVQEYGPDFFRFTIDLPAGWSAEKVDNGVQVVNSEKSVCVTVIVDKTEGADAKTLCKAIAEEAEMKEIQKEKQEDDGSYSVLGSVNGMQTSFTVTVEDDTFVCISISGDMSAASPILDSLKEKVSSTLREYGPSYSRFTVELPDDWTANQTPNGVQLVKNDKSTSVNIVIDKSKGLDSKTIATAVAKQSGMKIAQEQSKGNRSMVKGTINGVHTAIHVETEGDKFVCVSIGSATEDMSEAHRLIGTIKDK